MSGVHRQHKGCGMSSHEMTLSTLLSEAKDSVQAYSVHIAILQVRISLREAAAFEVALRHLKYRFPEYEEQLESLEMHGELSLLNLTVNFPFNDSFDLGYSFNDLGGIIDQTFDTVYQASPRRIAMFDVKRHEQKLNEIRLEREKKLVQLQQQYLGYRALLRRAEQHINTPKRGGSAAFLLIGIINELHDQHVA